MELNLSVEMLQALYHSARFFKRELESEDYIFPLDREMIKKLEEFISMIESL